MFGEKYISVSQLNAYAGILINSDAVLQNLFVTGEISNLKNHPSGNVYFTLKDDFSSIRCIVFKNQAGFMDWNIDNGTNILASGRAALYEKDGQFQFYVQALSVQGQGAVYASYEVLKKKLEAEGLFDYERKKPIPLLPERIGIVTSETGAVIRDIIHVSRRRYPNIDLLLCPVKVQGLGAGKEIAGAIETLNQIKNIDVIIIGRGGGSIEDLWAFNEEMVARSIAASRIPVVSAVGHQTNFTIADFVADYRAPTPSAAAEICVPMKAQLYDSIDGIISKAESMIRNALENKSSRLIDMHRSRAFMEIRNRFDTSQLILDSLVNRLNSTMERTFTSQAQRYDIIKEKLSVLNPSELLKRGFAIVEDVLTGERIRSVAAIRKDSVLRLIFADGKINVVAMQDVDDKGGLIPDE
jgi:exodeoxyribonuclease VII large subunit